MERMNRKRRDFFSLHDLLVMAALAALGGVSSAMISVVRAAAQAIIVVPGTMQFMAGIHVLWLVLAIGLVRKPGAATLTALLKGSVELLSGNPHGLLVLMYSVAAGIAVDIVWLLLGRSDRRMTYMLAGGFGSMSNVFAFMFVASIPASGGVLTGIAVFAGIAFVSGVFLAGLLGWWLLRALRRAGVIGAGSNESPVSESP
jgi:energy-coupling factor transport system substrate-specific component